MRDDETQSNVVKFDRGLQVDPEAPDLQCGPEVSEHLRELGHGSSADESPEILDESDQDSSSFILSEKRRFEQSSAKMRGKEVLKMYKQSAAVDLATERSLKEDLSKSSQVGILVDRKQA